MKHLQKFWPVLGMLLCAGAQAAPQVYSMTNINTIPQNNQVQCPTRTGGLSAVPNLGAVLQTQMSAAQQQLEERLKELQPTDPAYNVVKGMLDRLKATPAAPSAPTAPAAPEALAGSQTPVTLEQAIGMLKAALDGTLDLAAFAQLQAMPEYQSASKASALVPVAMADGKPLAAMALLLRAHELEPSNPNHLLNLSGLANYYGFWHESLALLEAARGKQASLKDPWGIKPQAALLNNQAHALLGLGQAVQAETTLRQALQLEPLLTEAQRNLAQALGEQGKCEEAARWYRLGSYRMPIKDMLGPDKGPVESEEADRITLKPYKEAYAMDAGVDGVFPNIPIPANIRQATLIAESIGAEMGRVTMMLGQKTQKYQQLWPAVHQKASNMLRNKDTRMTAEVALHLLGPIHSADPEDPELDALYEKADQAFEAYGKARSNADDIYGKAAISSAETYAAESAACGTNSPCHERARINHEQRLCAAGTRWHGSLVGDLQRYDMAYRAFYRPFHKTMTGLTAHLSDPQFFEAAKTQAQALYFQHYHSYLATVGMHMIIAGAYGGTCKDEVPPPDLVLKDPNDPEACEPSKIKPKAKVAALEVTYTCEKVEVELSTEGIFAGFVQVGYEFSKRHIKLEDPKERFIEKQAGRDPDRKLQLNQYGYAFNGKVSVFTGGKVTAALPVGVVEPDVGVKAGPYVVIDGGGNIVDAGGKIDTSHSLVVGAGLSFGYEVEGPGDSFSIMSSK